MLPCGGHAPDTVMSTDLPPSICTNTNMVLCCTISRDPGPHGLATDPTGRTSTCFSDSSGDEFS